MMKSTHRAVSIQPQKALLWGTLLCLISALGLAALLLH